MRTTLSLALVAAAVVSVDARPTYVARIPNGANVPDVAALGHVDPAGGGANNDFGLDFASAGESWTKEFCEKDSDGDGQTNGQELGDPCCEWVQDSNAVVEWTTGVSHPGDASLTSDESLWANIQCGSSNSSTTAGSTAGSSTGTVDAGTPTTSDTDATSSASGGATASSASASSSSAASSVSSGVYSAVGVMAAVATYFL